MEKIQKETITINKEDYIKLISDYENLMCLVTERFSKANTPIEPIIEAYNEKRKEDFEIYADEIVELLNCNKTKLLVGETRDVNEIFLDLEFIRGLISSK